jgi:hypothetical protein
MRERYFVAKPELQEKIDDLNVRFSAAVNEMHNYAIEHGGAYAVISYGKMVGIIFHNDPSSNIWRKDRNNDQHITFYVPKRNTKAGKEIAKRMNEFSIPSGEDILDMVNLRGYRATEGKRFKTAGITSRIRGKSIFLVPESDEICYEGHALLEEISYATFLEGLAWAAREEEEKAKASQK